jgi:hypothetical protein
VREPLIETVAMDVFMLPPFELNVPIG